MKQTGLQPVTFLLLGAALIAAPAANAQGTIGAALMGAPAVSGPDASGSASLGSGSIDAGEAGHKNGAPAQQPRDPFRPFTLAMRLHPDPLVQLTPLQRYELGQ